MPRALALDVADRNPQESRIRLVVVDGEAGEGRIAQQGRLRRRDHRLELGGVRPVEGQATSGLRKRTGIRFRRAIRPARNPSGWPSSVLAATPAFHRAARHFTAHDPGIQRAVR